MGIRYKASSNLHIGSQVSCVRFDLAPDASELNGFSPGIKNEIANDIGAGITGDTAIPSDPENNTTSNTERGSGTKNDTTGDSGIKTTTDTGIPSDHKPGTPGNTTNGKNHAVDLRSGTGRDTASDTLFLNTTNKRKQEEKENPKEKFRIPDFRKVEAFFYQNQLSKKEALRFFNHYELADWKTADQMPVRNWQELALSWDRNNKNNTHNGRQSNQNRAGRFSAATGKDYSEPL